MKMEVAGHCTVEKQSVYGAVIALPQIARSVRAGPGARERAGPENRRLDLWDNFV